MNENCLFCKIVKGEIPAQKLYEDEHTIAFLDIRPINKGHALVIPKDHFTDLTDTPAPVLAQMTAAVKKVVPAIVKATEADGFNIGMNNKQAAGQVVMHVHAHIIPRFSNDGLKHWHRDDVPSPDEMKKIQESIIHFLGKQ